MSAHPETTALFDRWARKGRAEGMEDGHKPRALPGLEAIPVAPGDRLLDLGCGNGWATRWLRRAAGAGGSAAGLDAAPEMVARARAATDEAGLDGLEFVVGSFAALPWPDASFDHAWSFEALYYAPDLHRALLEIRRVLKPGGSLTMGTDFYEEHRESRDWPEQLGIPMKLLSADGWQLRLEAAGFTIVDRFTSDVSLLLRGVTKSEA